MPVGNLLEDIAAEPLAKFHHTLLMAGGAEMAALTGKCQQILMAAVFTLHTGKAVVQITAVQIAVNDLLEIGAVESVLPLKLFLIDLDKGFKMIFNFTGNNQKTEDFGGGKRRQEQTRFFSFGKIRPPYNRTNVLFVKGESKCTVRGR